MADTICGQLCDFMITAIQTVGQSAAPFKWAACLDNNTVLLLHLQWVTTSLYTH